MKIFIQLFFAFLLSFPAFSQFTQLNSNSETTETKEVEDRDYNYQLSDEEQLAKLSLDKEQAADEFRSMIALLYNADGTLKPDAAKMFLKGPYVEKMTRLTQQMIKDVPTSQLKNDFAQQLEPKGYGHLVEEYPNFFNFIIELLKDENILVDFLRGFRNFTKFKTYLFCLILLFVLRYFINKQLRKKDRFILIRLFNWMLITFTFMILNLTCMYYIYRQELRPVVHLARQHF